MFTSDTSHFAKFILNFSPQLSNYCSLAIVHYSSLTFKFSFVDYFSLLSKSAIVFCSSLTNVYKNPLLSFSLIINVYFNWVLLVFDFYTLWDSFWILLKMWDVFIALVVISREFFLILQEFVLYFGISELKSINGNWVKNKYHFFYIISTLSSSTWDL